MVCIVGTYTVKENLLSFKGDWMHVHVVQLHPVNTDTENLKKI